MHAKAKEALDYWFGDLDHTPAYFGERSRLWFMGGKKVDEEIRKRFGAEVELAGTGNLDAWRETPRGSLALVVLLDQFALNVHRNEAKGYLLSEMAIPIAKEILAKGWEFALTPAEKTFVYMPLEHSEDMADQELCVAKFRKMVEQAPGELKEILQGSLDYAERHMRVVKRFGRFPHRNEALKRKSSPEEIAFLASSEAPF